MNRFESSLFDSVFAKLIRNITFLFYVFLLDCLLGFSDLIWHHVSVIELVGLYVLFFLVQIVLTNNDLIVKEGHLIIRASLSKKIRYKKINVQEIQEVIFKDEWSEGFMSQRYTSVFRFIVLQFLLQIIFPWEYKWILIRMKNGKEHKFYFFGLNYDFYENVGEILFEDMFIALAERGIKVKWKSTKDKYFKDIQERADKILRETK